MIKKIIPVIFFLFSVTLFSQSPRLCLFEEFTGENCPPCAIANPVINTTLANPINQTKIVAIKWQVPIPSASSNTWSLYQTNKTEIDWRHGSIGNGGYGYSGQWTNSNAPSSGINAAPTGLIDGQHLWQFGAPSDHAGSINNTIINTAQSFTSSFSIVINRTWDPNYTGVTLTVNIQATANYTSNANLVFRLVMIERHIHFATQSGTNGEKDFEDVARQSFPSIQLGTPMVPTWTVGQTQTFTINCPIPSHVLNKAEVAFVGFIQNDGTRKVEQAALADAVGQNDDAKAESILIPDIVCGSSLTPMVTIKNHGDNSIGTLTITSYLDGVALAPYIWSGVLVPGSSNVISINTLSLNAGTHSFSFNISAVNGASDSYTINNSLSHKFISIPVYNNTPVIESFSLGVFPPSNWAIINGDNGIYSWSRSPSVGAYGTNSGALRYDFFNNNVSGDIDDLYLPPTDLSGINSPSLTFDVAYAEYPGGYLDGLEVLISSNCGNNWTSIYSKAAPILSTAPATTSNFFPTATQWRKEVIPLSSYTATPNVIVKFRAINQNGNNVWIDNVNLSDVIVSTTNIKKEDAAVNISAVLYPNPAEQTTNLRIDSDVKVNAYISIINILGEVVYFKRNNLEIGTNNFVMDTKDFARGVYTIVLSSERKTIIEKLILTK